MQVPYWFRYHLCCVISDTTDGSAMNRAQKIIDQCIRYNFNVHVAHVSDYMDPDCKLHGTNCVPAKNMKLEDKFSSYINKMPSTISNDLYPKIKRNLFIRYAKLLECNFVFTAETTTKLASNLLSNIALGRGSQVQNDVVSYLFTICTLLIFIKCWWEMTNGVPTVE